MNINEVELYNEEIKKYASKDIDWEKLRDKTFLITGATGLIGKFLIDVIMYKNDADNLNCKIIYVQIFIIKLNVLFFKFRKIVFF